MLRPKGSVVVVVGGVVVVVALKLIGPMVGISPPDAPDVLFLHSHWK